MNGESWKASRILPVELYVSRCYTLVVAVWRFSINTWQQLINPISKDPRNVSNRPALRYHGISLCILYVGACRY